MKTAGPGPLVVASEPGHGFAAFLGEFQSDPDATPGLTGTGGTETFRFEAANTGYVVLQLVYHRPWEVDVEPVETFVVELLVR